MKVVQLVEGHNFHVDWHFKFWVEKNEKLTQRAVPPVQDIECHSIIGKPFLQNLLIKNPYSLCESCMWVWDLQLSYSTFGALLYKNLELFNFEQRVSNTFEAAMPQRRDVACAGRPRRPRHPPPKTTRRPRRATSPCAAPWVLGVLPAAGMRWTAPYWPVRAADRRSIGSTLPYARRSRWLCYGSISSVTATSPGGLNYKNPSAVRPPHATPTRQRPLLPPPCDHTSASSHRRPTFPTYSLGP
jgi:hypothetical protein